MDLLLMVSGGSRWLESEWFFENEQPREPLPGDPTRPAPLKRATPRPTQGCLRHGRGPRTLRRRGRARLQGGLRAVPDATLGRGDRALGRRLRGGAGRHRSRGLRPAVRRHGCPAAAVPARPLRARLGVAGPPGCGRGRSGRFRPRFQRRLAAVPAVPARHGRGKRRTDAWRRRAVCGAAQWRHRARAAQRADGGRGRHGDGAPPMAGGCERARGAVRQRGAGRDELDAHALA